MSFFQTFTFVMLSDGLMAWSDIEIGPWLGTGAYAEVFSGRRSAGACPNPSDDDWNLAIKFLRDEPDVAFSRELDIMIGLDHETCLNLVGFILSYGELPEDVAPKVMFCRGPILVTERMKNGSLQAALMGEQPLDATTMMKSFIGIAAGMFYLHSKGILHRDLKLENVLLDENWEVKVADFGLSRNLSLLGMTSDVGDPMIQAPELNDGYEYNEQADVYSYGVTLFYHWVNRNNEGSLVLTRDEDYDPEILLDSITDSGVLIQYIRSGYRWKNTPGIPDFYWNLICACWRQDFRERPTFGMILKEFIEAFKDDQTAFLPLADHAQVRAYLARVTRSLDLPKPCDISTEVLTQFLSSHDPKATPF